MLHHQINYHYMMTMSNSFPKIVHNQHRILFIYQIKNIKKRKFLRKIKMKIFKIKAKILLIQNPTLYAKYRMLLM